MHLNCHQILVTQILFGCCLFKKNKYIFLEERVKEEEEKEKEEKEEEEEEKGKRGEGRGKGKGRVDEKRGEEFRPFSQHTAASRAQTGKEGSSEHYR